MKLKFKHQAYQAEAVDAVVECFAGQPKQSGIGFRIDPGRKPKDGQQKMVEEGFKNPDLRIPKQQLLENIRTVQRNQNLEQSAILVESPAADLNLDIEMETGTGKTYCYIKSMFELNKRFGWSKFIVVVPSIAIREGVHKSLEITADHFRGDYGKSVRFFIYNSKQLHNLESFSSDAGINVMVINAQAFAARDKDQRRIYKALDDFQSRSPIDVIKANRPILILDEPHRLEGATTVTSLKKFNPLFVLRYSATHNTEHNKIHRLDALDAYNQKLVKKIAVRGITVKGLSGTHPYLYLESIQIYTNKPPEARIEFEIKQKKQNKRVVRKIGKNDNLFDKSGGLSAYKGFVVANIDARTETVTFTNGDELRTGEATGDVNESTLRRLQIRETIRAHFDKEQELYDRGIKVLSLFFIDAVAKYRVYDENGEQGGEYAKMFEEEYNEQLNEILELEPAPYQTYLKGIDTARTHNGYFSIDKKSKRLVDPKTGARSTEADDVDAYDLILKDKERLLSHAEPVRFIFSHSALREGWDNPNVFVICTLKHSDNTISRRQEVGRGLRIAVNQHGDRQDDPAMVHDTNILTVVANESYTDFVKALQKDMSDSLSSRPTVADEAYFIGKIIPTEDGQLAVTPQLAKMIYRYLVKNDYTDDNDQITQTYHDARSDETIAKLPEDLQPHAEQILKLIDSVFSPGSLPTPEDGRAVKENPTNKNLHKKEFLELWNRINRKAVYSVHFETDELVANCVTTLNTQLKVTPLQYTIHAGIQKDETSYDDLKMRDAFEIENTETKRYTGSVQSAVTYDLIGQIADPCRLKRDTVARILKGIKASVFALYSANPEHFLREAARLINEQKASMVIEHLTYDPVDEVYDIELFTQHKRKAAFDKAVRTERHVFDYVFTDSKIEKDFVKELDKDSDVVVYAKLPDAFLIPTPVGNYNPDWAVAFQEGSVKHIYFIAETKGNLNSMELRALEKSKIQCARKFFHKITSNAVKFEVVDSYSALMNLVKG